MSARLLGPAFDIHGGGQDLIFPHHENELAQGAALNRPMANIWAHNGFVNVDHEKMSKSLGNFFSVKDVLKIWPGEVLRFFLVSKHYRAPIEFSEEGLRESGKALERVYRASAGAQAVLKGRESEPSREDDESVKLLELFDLAMDDDLNASQALGHVFEVVRLLNRAVDAVDVPAALGASRALETMGKQLELWRRDPDEFFESLKVGSDEEPSREEIEKLVAARNAARADKDWPEADRLRTRLTELGVALEDKAGTTVWRRI
jgi:cysteinyl-tRNA synthetase